MPDAHPSSCEHLDSVFRTHRPMVRRALRQLGVHEAALEDATQDVFVVLLRRFQDYDPRRSLTNWLWGIARGVASTYRRTTSRRQRFLASLPAAPEPPGLDERMARAQASTILDRFLSTLDEDKCAVFVLAEIEGRTGPEIARQLSVNVNTVYARLRAARARLEQVVQRHRGASLRAKVAAVLAWPVSWSTSPVMAGASTALAAMLVVPSAMPGSPGLQWSPAAAPISTDVEQARSVVAQAPSRDRARAAKDPGEGTQLDPMQASSVPEEEPMSITTKTTTTLTTLAVAGLLATPVQAKPKAGERWKAPVSDQDADEAARVSGDEDQTTRYIFDDDALEGEVLNPDGTMIMHRPQPKMPSLISLRGHFVPELIRLGSDV